jgi:hypothetical protein
MRRISKYNITAEWDDPFERHGDRRKSERCAERFKIKIGVRIPEHKNLLAGTGLVQNISLEGMLCRTKHTLEVGQEIHLSIPTRDYSSAKDFPNRFVGTGHVNRVKILDGALSEVGITFDPSLSEDMSFSIFIESLQAIASLKSAL